MNTIKKVLIIAAVICITVFTVYSYSSRGRNLSFEGFEGEHIEWRVTESNKGRLKVKLGRYNGRDTWVFAVKKGESIRLSYNSEIKEGTFKMFIEDSKGNVIFDMPSNSKGSKVIKTEKDEQWRLVTEGDNAKDGTFELIFK
jgi:hypothetical protein